MSDAGNTNTIRLSIDGKEIVADAGKTILTIARENGIDIPTLCHDPRLPAYGSCLVCVVEVEGQKKLPLSCTTEASDGMKVVTESERIFQARKDALEMLFSNHYADCRGPCYEACPANVDVQGYLALAHEGKDKEALELIRETNPLPLVCGRVCVRYCEAACARNDVDTPVAINFIKRYVSSLQHDNLDPPQKAAPNGKRVAVIGGGPGGLTASHYLARAGCAVTIFEAHSKLGGMLRYGIPDYRLDQDILDKEIQYILDHGVDVKTNTRLGTDFTLDELKEQGFDAIFIALGAQKAKSMRVENEEAEGVVGGIEFLEQVVKEGAPELTGHVLIIGGGNTAIDASRSALRCGADKVSILYRRTRREMPADEVEIEDAIEEGVNVDFLVAPIEVLVDENGRLRALRCQKMELGEPDKSGRRRPVPIEGSEFDIDCTLAVAAIGQDTEISGVRQGAVKLGELKTTRWDTLVTAEHTFATNIEGVFAGGDVVTGPEAAIDAIAHGRKAAEAMIEYLELSRVPEGKAEFLSKRINLAEVPEDYWQRFEKVERSKMRYRPIKERIADWKEAELGIAPDEVGKETGRCLSCGCSDVFTCDLKKYGDLYSSQQTRFSGKAKRYEPDLSHPHVALDANKCIVCGRCVRTCDDLQGVAALGFVNRGFDMIVRPAMNKPLSETTCISCGNCIDACPTGAIAEKLPFDRPGPWKTEPAESLCNYCGVGCRVVYNKVSDDIWYVSAKQNDAWTPGELCVRGRFGHRGVLSHQRLVSARVKTDNGESCEVSIEQAAKEAAAGLAAISDAHGPEALGFFVSPKATNEEVFLLQTLARQAFGTNNIGSLYDLAPSTSYRDLTKMLGVAASTVTRRELEDADVVVVLDGNLGEENPVLSFAVHRARRANAELVVLGSASSRLTDNASLWLDTRRGTSNVILEAVASELCRGLVLEEQHDGLADYLTRVQTTVAHAAKVSGADKEHIRALVELVSAADKKVVFVFNAGATAEKTPGDLQAVVALLLLTNRFMQPGSGLLLTHEHSNMQGHLDLAGNADALAQTRLCLPGADELAGARDIEELGQLLEQNKLKGLCIFGEDFAVDAEHQKLLSEAEFVVVIDMFETETSARANVAIPGSAYAESRGSVTNQERYVQTFEPAFAPPAGKTGFEVLALLYEAASGEAPTIEQVRKRIGELNPSYAQLAGNQSFRWGTEKQNGTTPPLFAERFLTSDGKAHLSSEEPAQPRGGHAGCYSTIDRMYERSCAEVSPRK
jgi:formate dehydrogenase major subunit